MTALRINLRKGGLLLTVLLLTGCALLPRQRTLAFDPFLPASIELTQTPFFPQTDYQCGPAALATLLVASGANVTPEALSHQVYLPARKGSLQLELIAASRRQDRIPYLLEPNLHALMSEVAAQHPVMVLQNLGLDWMPIWHYAVVIGFNQQNSSIILRSGSEKRQQLPLAIFLHTWERADHWAMVALPPDQLPITANENQFLSAVQSLESMKRFSITAKAYQKAVERWPKSLGAWIGLGNSLYALQNFAEAETAFTTATELHPNSVIAFNNLADTLAMQDKREAALIAAQRSVALGGTTQEKAIARRTLEQILQQLHR